MEILKEMPKRNPINGTFELTVRCNLKCKMCLFRHDDSENEKIMANELTAAQWIDMAKQVAEAGTLNLLITGGEPMLRPDFCEIYEEIYKLGFIVELYTNATLVTDKVMETLRKYPPHKIGVTLYGASEETYEKVCGNGQAFNKALEGIRRLKTLSSLIQIRTTLIKDNVNDINAIEEITRELLGESARVIHSSYVLKSVRGGNGKSEECRLSPKDNMQLTLIRNDRRVKNYFEAKGLCAPKYNYNNNYRNKVISLLGCNAGMDSYTITWNGKLIGCQIIDRFYTEPFKNGFKRAWEEYPYKVKVPKRDESCLTCCYSDYCSTCYAIHYAETGTLNKCPKYFYKQAKVLYEYFQEDDKE